MEAAIMRATKKQSPLKINDVLELVRRQLQDRFEVNYEDVVGCIDHLCQLDYLERQIGGPWGVFETAIRYHPGEEEEEEEEVTEMQAVIKRLSGSTSAICGRALFHLMVAKLGLQQNGDAVSVGLEEFQQGMLRLALNAQITAKSDSK